MTQADATWEAIAGSLGQAMQILGCNPQPISKTPNWRGRGERFLVRGEAEAAATRCPRHVAERCLLVRLEEPRDTAVTVVGGENSPAQHNRW